MLSERRQLQKTIYCIIHVYAVFRIGKSRATEADCQFLETEHVGKWGMTAEEWGVALGDEMFSNGLCRWLHNPVTRLTPLNWTLWKDEFYGTCIVSQ